ncbi:MAG: hypothetical protein ABEH88_08270 [Halobacteriales archaeon]
MLPEQVHFPGSACGCHTENHAHRRLKFPRCATGTNADVVRFLEADPAVAFEVSANEPPYKGVRSRGMATITPDEGKSVLRALIERYLGDTDIRVDRTVDRISLHRTRRISIRTSVDPYTPPGPRLLGAERTEVTITIDPERVHSWDFTTRMSE